VSGVPAFGQETPGQPKTYILDASAIIRFLDKEAGSGRVREILRDHAVGSCRVVVCALHWGEVALTLVRRVGTHDQDQIMRELLSLGFEIIPATGERAVRSAQIKGRLGIPYVDAFGVELAGDSPAHVFVTADFDMKSAAAEVEIEFLPTK
jgi:predicted nucleic acid-binding protein